MATYDVSGSDALKFKTGMGAPAPLTATHNIDRHFTKDLVVFDAGRRTITFLVARTRQVNFIVIAHLAQGYVRNGYNINESDAIIIGEVIRELLCNVHAIIISDTNSAYKNYGTIAQDQLVLADTNSLIKTQNLGESHAIVMQSGGYAI